MNADIYYHGPVVVFDLDDTLYRERDFCRSGFSYLHDKIISMGLVPPEGLIDKMNEALARRESPFDVFENLCAPLFEKSGLQWNLAEHISDYRAHCPDIHLAAETQALLDNLADTGIKIGLISDGRSCTQRNKIKSLGLDQYIEDENILISEETGFDKSSRKPFVKFVARYPEASKFYYIGDNPEKDFIYPNKLGWETVMIAYNNDNVHPLPDKIEGALKPKHTIAKLPELLNLLSSDFNNSHD